MKTQIFSPLHLALFINLIFTAQIYSIDEYSYEEYIINAISNNVVKVHCESTHGDDLGEVNLKSGDTLHWHITAAPDTDFVYMCSFSWNDLLQIFEVYNFTIYNDKFCATDNGNNCYFLIARDGFYFSKDNSTSFPGSSWRYIYPWKN